MEKLLGRKFNNREECVEAVFNACRNDNFKPSVKNSVKGYQIYFRCEFAEKVQRKKKTPRVDSKRRKIEKALDANGVYTRSMQKIKTTKSGSSLIKSTMSTMSTENLSSNKLLRSCNQQNK